jgi:hypothetical protein
MDTHALVFNPGGITHDSGVVIESIPHTNLNGKLMAGKNSLMMCLLM